MTTRIIRLPRTTKPAEPLPASPPFEPIVCDETGSGWHVWHDDERYPSRNFAAAVARDFCGKTL